VVISWVFTTKAPATSHQHGLYRLWRTLMQGGPVNFYALAIGAGSIALILLLRLLVRRFHLPQIKMLIALIVAAGIAAYLLFLPRSAR